MTIIKSAKMLKLIKRLGLIGVGLSAFVLTIVLTLSFLPKGNDAFSIVIDDISEAESHFTMSSSFKGDTASFLRAAPLREAKLTTAQDVEDYLDSLPLLSGSQNMVEEDGDKANEKAIVYTVYLENTSIEQDQEIYYTVNLDGYAKPTNDAAFPLDYFRVLIRSEEVGKPETRENLYYGQHRTKYTETPTELEDNTREMIAINKDKVTKLDPDGNTHFYTNFSSQGNDGYCINFTDYELNGVIVNDEVHSKVVIPAGSAICFTFAAYFEGNDLDAYGGNAPKNSYLLLSLHFGVKTVENNAE